ncbi:MAG TPA: hypothetical protein PKZ27_07615 [Rhodocyclaceae bacterium]|nr:hypothetical protein [Rhodocyclaceae bacterium]
MIDDDQIAITPEPIGEHHLSRRDGDDILAATRTNEHAAPLRTSIRPWSTKTSNQFSADGKSHFSTQLRKAHTERRRPGRPARPTRDGICAFGATARLRLREFLLRGAKRHDLQHPPEFFLVPAQGLNLLLLRTDLPIQHLQGIRAGTLHFLQFALLPTLFRLEHNQAVASLTDGGDQLLQLPQIGPQRIDQFEPCPTDLLHISRVTRDLVGIASRQEKRHIISTVHVVTPEPAGEFRLARCDPLVDPQPFRLLCCKILLRRCAIIAQLPQAPACSRNRTFGGCEFSRGIGAARLRIGKGSFEFADTSLHLFQVGAALQDDGRVG